MEHSIYEAEARTEEFHWWFTGRRKLFSRIIQRLELGPADPILDVGTSTGANLRMLRDLGFRNVTGLDSSPAAIRFCNEKGFPRVELGDAVRMPFAAESFRLVLATDIIEHVDDDGAATAEIARVLRMDGMALITVPAFQSLWGLNDEAGHHKRRYRMKGLVDVVRAGGLEPLDAFYFNYLLFGPIWAVRRMMKAINPESKGSNELVVKSNVLNKLIGAVFDFDVVTAPSVRPPFGVSALVLARKSASAS